MIFYDDENNVIIPHVLDPLVQADRAVITEFNRTRLLLAAEFMRCGITTIDGALDDADTALGYLNRNGLVTFEHKPTMLR
jgi:hypothetical protein